MFGSTVGSGLTFTKVLGGISKTLSIANQVIPLYREAKPMINNAKTIMSVLKDVGKSKDASSNSKTSNKTIEKKKDSIVESIPKTSSNNPVFFL